VGGVRFCVLGSEAAYEIRTFFDDSDCAGAGGTQLKAWVSGEGSDTVSCGAVSTPCRSLQYAHDNIVEPGGTIYVHDVGGYGQLIISHAISVINDGVGAAVINAASGDGIDVQAGTNDAVIIKGLTLDGAGTGTNGINLSSASSLTIVNCLIKGFGSGTGILLEPNSGASDVNFIISDTTVLGSGQDGIGVIGLGYAQSSIRGAITRVETSNNGGSGVDFFGHNRFAVMNLAVTDDSIHR
jgi:hypothetical protein